MHVKVEICSKFPPSQFLKDSAGMEEKLKATSHLQTLKNRLFFVFLGAL